MSSYFGITFLAVVIGAGALWNFIVPERVRRDLARTLLGALLIFVIVGMLLQVLGLY